MEPTERLGANLESIKELKEHPFFNGINFDEVSSPSFIGARQLVVQLIYKIHSEKQMEKKGKSEE